MAVLAAFAIFLFLWTYNDYLIAVTMAGWRRPELPGHRPHRGAIRGVRPGRTPPDRGSLLLTLLPIIVFFALQRFFVTSILAGPVKG